LADGKFIAAQIVGRTIFICTPKKNRMVAEMIFQPFEINNNLEKRRRAMTLVSGLL